MESKTHPRSIDYFNQSSRQGSSLLKNTNPATAVSASLKHQMVLMKFMWNCQLHFTKSWKFRNWELPRATPILELIQFPQRKSIVISERQTFHSTPQQTAFLISISSHLLKHAPSQDFTGSLGFTNFRVLPFLDYSTSRTPYKRQQSFY